MPAPLPGAAGAPQRQESLLRRDDSPGFKTTAMPARRDEGAMGGPAQPESTRLSVPPPPVASRPGGFSGSDNLPGQAAGSGGPDLPRAGDLPLPGASRQLPPIGGGAAAAPGSIPPPAVPAPGDPPPPPGGSAWPKNN
jgi:hypothetical protein